MATAFLRRSSLTVTRKSTSRKTVRVCMAENRIADAVDVGPNTHGDDRN